MKGQLEAMRRCEAQGLDPAEAFSNQFVITEAGSPGVAGMRPCALQNWVLHHGGRVERIEMRDRNRRAFGVFIGIGVDGDGALVGADSFARFDSRDPSFAGQVDTYLSGIAGRYAALVECGAQAWIHTDPMAHMTLFYNAAARRVASSLALTIDRALRPDPLISLLARDGGGGAFPLGHSPDEDVRWLMPNHRLDLAAFTATRCWPFGGGPGKAGAGSVAAAVPGLVARQAQIVAALAGGCACLMPVTGGRDLRVILASARKGGVPPGMGICFETDPAAVAEAVAGQHICDRLVLPFARYHRREALQLFGNDRAGRQRRRALFELRTSGMLTGHGEILTGLIQMQPEGYLHLRPEGIDLIRAAAPAADLSDDPDVELGYMLGMAAPSGAALAAWRGPYRAWKAGLPEPARAAATDFIHLEMYLPLGGLYHYACAESFYLSPFSDRASVALMLQAPPAARRGKGLCDAIIAEADPALADFPYTDGASGAGGASVTLPEAVAAADANTPTDLRDVS